MRDGSVTALPAGEDARAAALRIGHARERFLSSRVVASCVRSVVASSWQRCAAAGASPDAHRLPALRMDAGALAGYRARHPLAALLPLFRELLGERAADGDYIFAVTDAAGTLLWVQGHRGLLRQAERMNFVEGAAWSEAEAGTNAPGTALALERPVQVFTAEHYNSVVHPWSCSAAVIRDPASGRVLGAIDITGGEVAAGPQALALVRATARAAEGELALRMLSTGARVGQAYADRVTGASALPSLALAGPALPSLAPASPALPSLAPASPALGPVLAPVLAPGLSPVGGAARLSALGRDCALLELDGRVIRLRPRHSEIVVLLALAMRRKGTSGEGLSGPRLAVELSEKEIHPVTLRAEMSRLRRLLGAELLGSRPYTLRRLLSADFTEVGDLLAEGRLAAALDAYPGPLLPDSEAPAIIEQRVALEQWLRAEVLASADVTLLRRWVGSAWGMDDTEARLALARRLPPSGRGGRRRWPRAE